MRTLLHNRSHNQGFTLIELLVVIAIIGLLSSIILASLNSARVKGRDARRVADLRQLQTALGFYYDKFGKYPGENWGCDSSIGAQAGGCPISSPQPTWNTSSDLQSLVSGGFIPSLPIDPINNTSYYYYYEPNNSGQGSCPASPANTPCEYQLWTQLEKGVIYCVRDSQTNILAAFGCPGP